MFNRKVKKVVYSVMALTLMAGGLLATERKTDAAPIPETVTYSALSSFGASQGIGNWFNMKKTGTVYSYLGTYDATTPAKWKEASGYPYVRDSFFHPETTNDAVKKWVAPQAGNVTITGNVLKVNASSNGVIAKIFKNTTQLWSATVTSAADATPSGVSNIHVEAGDALYFVINANGDMNFDETNWSPVVTMTTAIKIEAESYDSMSGVSAAATTDTGGGQQVGSFDTNDYLVYNNVNLSGGYKTLEARVADTATGGKFEVRLDSLTGPVISTFTVANTDGWNNFETQSWPITGSATGTHNLYVKGVVGAGIANINWFRLTNNNTRGATVPFTTYEAESGTLGGGATTNNDATVKKEASSGKSYVHLDATNESVQWTNVRDANRMIVRYSIPQNSSGTLALYVNGVKRQDLSLTSTFNYDTAPGNSYVRSFDDKDFAIDINAGDTIMLKKDSGNSLAWYGIDLIDLETAAAPIALPANAISVKSSPYNAVGNGVADDTAAIQSAVNAAASLGKNVYFPPGTYNQSDKITVPSGVSVYGAGIWYSHLHSTVTNNVWGGEVGFTLNNNTTISDLRISSVDTQRDSHYGIAILSNAGTGSNNVLQNLWAEHMGCLEGWTDWKNSTIQNVRLYNTYFDGIHWGDDGNSGNVAQNNFMRGLGDDGVAQVNLMNFANVAQNNVAQFNTIIASYWGRGMSDVGGNSLTYRDNYIDSTYLAGMIITTEPVEPTKPSYTISGLKFQRNTINKAGHTGHNHASIQFWLDVNPMQNVRVELNTITNGETEGIHIDNTSYGDSGGRTQFNFNVASGNALSNYTNANSLVVPVLNGNTGF
ncbi:carbohydrate-binding protein [Paenibacillus rhizovicinus]|uniref:Carbohydrate-binding protein n=1 Tax=Paenibacillus rhizovicinus TaxID=2704463 RepID=A0A6C0NU38_9BACL|nr:carbohydrate-binding protein [Paenibacillus rhizovicinus]QHW29730.1 carbohydrate-binding protein [Paenibacillus rhizovicinus]